MGTLLAIPGIGGANPLPEPFQRYTTYTIGISSKATQPKGARAFLRALEGPAARAVVARHGLEPLHR
jgi:ABC-type molybdate transport system substrate-binding protein